MVINESILLKGQLRKLNALRNSVGDKIGAQAFEKWMKQRLSSEKKEMLDPAAEKVRQALSELVNDKALHLGNLGYTIRRAKGKGASGFLVTKNKKM